MLVLHTCTHTHLVIVNCGILNIYHWPLTALRPASKPSATDPGSPGARPTLLLLLLPLPHLLLRLRKCVEERVLLRLAPCLLLPHLRSSLQRLQRLTALECPCGLCHGA